MIEETFIKLLGYNGNFYVSNKGRVYDVANKKFLPQYRLNNGRLAVDIGVNGKKYMYQVDKLVVNTWFHMPFKFVGRPILDIEHIDGDLTNNCSLNLKPLYNMEIETDDLDWTLEKPSEQLQAYDEMMERILERGKRIAENALERQKEKTKETS